ncbi:hypothetical protein N4R57_08605 [Rhodobacteraceae bacterium D3-12]|nr:hypothetical protein N4R57_08605 [Rhodobacteraceae bacterium D3-12]
MFEVELDPVFGVADPLLARAILESDQGGRGLFADLLFAVGEDRAEEQEAAFETGEFQVGRGGPESLAVG